MKAIRVRELGPPSVMKIENIEAPPPGRGQVLVRIHAAGVNPVDTYIRSGAYAVKPALPYTPGTDGAGVVQNVGDEVMNVKTGDRVYTASTITGTYAELALCDARQVYPLPEGLTFSQGAGIFVPYATAQRALFQKAQAKAGETVLIHGGSGGVGTAAIQMARAAGLTVIATAGTQRGLELVREQGADHAANHKEDGYTNTILDLTGGKGVDIVLEMLANVNLGKDLTLLAPHGRVVVIGSRGAVEINPRDAMAREAVVMGMVLWNATPAELSEIHAALAVGFENGSLKPVVGQELPLEDAPKAHEAVMEPGAFGKIVLLP